MATSSGLPLPRTGRRRRAAAWALVLLWAAPVAAAASGRKVAVSLALNSGGVVQGRVVEYDDARVLLEVQQQVVTLEWDRVRTPSAYQARKKILETERGGARYLTAEDHFQLGCFLAVRNNHSAAVSEFRKATQRDPAYADRIKQVWLDIRRDKERVRKDHDTLIRSRRDGSAAPAAIDTPAPGGGRQYTPEQHAAALNRNYAFGGEIRERIAPELVLLETHHFLIWTDWPEHKRNLLSRWSEEMYRQMCQEFGFAPEQPVWLGKCPLFIFWHKAHFEKFAEAVDDYHRPNTLGYTKTTASGYVHVVLRRLGNGAEDLNRFATTMVHEASHAFMHAYGPPQNLPPWLSEGFADYVAERVLGDRCPTGETAASVAREYVAGFKQIDALFSYTDSPPGHYYPIAYSLVQFLIERDHAAFVDLINDLKAGRSLPQSLARRYQGMTLKTLEHGWRVWIKRTADDPQNLR